MRLTIARHGRPHVEDFGPIKSNQMKDWIKSYNSAPLSSESVPSDKLKSLVKDAHLVVCSDARRSIDSAVLLGARKLDAGNDQFQEAGLPYGKIAMLRLRPIHWAVIFRIAWYFGYSKNSESILDFRARSRVAASILNELAEENGNVVLVGHVFLNKLVSNHLLNMGWSGSKTYSSYWSFNTYYRERT